MYAANKHFCVFTAFRRIRPEAMIVTRTVNFIRGIWYQRPPQIRRVESGSSIADSRASFSSASISFRLIAAILAVCFRAARICCPGHTFLCSFQWASAQVLLQYRGAAVDPWQPPHRNIFTRGAFHDSCRAANSKSLGSGGIIPGSSVMPHALVSTLRHTRH